MKPVIITVYPDNNGRVRLTIKELQDMLDKAYAAGKADGSSIHYDCPKQWWWTSGTGTHYYSNDITTAGSGSNITLTSCNDTTTGSTGITINS